MKKRTRRPAKQGLNRRARKKPKAAKPDAAKKNDRDKYGRFLKGMSGNPNGRPRLSKGILALRSALEEIETGVDGMPVMSIASRLHQMAMTGGAPEMRLYMQLRFGMPRPVDVADMPEGAGDVQPEEYRVSLRPKQEPAAPPAESPGDGGKLH